MKCENAQELFPELQDHPERYPEAMVHIETCSSCRTLFHIFERFTDNSLVPLSESKRKASYQTINKKMHRQDFIVLTRRVTSVAAVIMLALISVFNINNSASSLLADISDEILFLQSGINMVPEITMDDNAKIEYLAQYENIDVLGDLF
ncbi:MAG: hypothetical protein KAT14_05930 [Candidatus Marinimicrobia bacterium]|nr:hypothetical protein [Candidatus Neomarinimicrobiota bacterium]